MELQAKVVEFELERKSKTGCNFRVLNLAVE